MLITGGCGFIGSCLARAGLNNGWEVTIYDDFSRFGPEHLGNILPSVTVVRGKVEDPASLRKVVRGSDIVYHLAGISRAVGSVDNPRGFFETNTVGTHNVFAGCMDAAVRVVFASSYIVYGRNSRIGVRMHESDPPSPETPYALSKLVGENYAQLYNNLYEQDNVCLRFSNVYGPNDRDRVVPAMISRAIKNETIKVNGNPHFLNFIYVEDLVEALTSIAKVRVLKHRLYNIGSPKSVNLIDLAKIIVEKSQSSSQIQAGPLPLFEPEYYCPDVTQASQGFGFVAKTELEVGVERCVKSALKEQEGGRNEILQNL